MVYPESTPYLNRCSLLDNPVIGLQLLISHIVTLVKMPMGPSQNGPRHEKTCLQGFRQIEFQNSLLNYKD